MRIVLIIVALIVGAPILLWAGLGAFGIIAFGSPFMALTSLLGLQGDPATGSMVQSRFQAPDGFAVDLYTADVPKARMLRVTSAGDLLVSRSHLGDVLLLRRDANGDGHPDAIETIADNLTRPHGLDIHDGWLYIAESNRVGRIRFDAEKGSISGPYESVVDNLTNNGNHWSKTISFGPDGRLYLAQGSTCNVCEEEDSRRATIMRFAPDGSAAEVFATGLRNSVGFDWAPWDGALYATDNGRDLLGNDFPPCELNQVVEGGFYGWPYFNGANVPDPSMGADPLAAQRTPLTPVFPLPPHNAPLGITFPDTQTWPGDYERVALIALHGSWNRSSPDGYKVVSLHWRDGGIEQRDFLTGFLEDGDVVGRPVDVAQGPDGAIYVSDDYAGAIYRVRQGSPTTAAAFELPAALSQLDEAPPTWLATIDAAAYAARGAELYSANGCAACHEQGENPVSLEGLSDRLGYAAVIETLRAPAPPMPALPLPEEDYRALAVFLLQDLLQDLSQEKGNGYH